MAQIESNERPNILVLLLIIISILLIGGLIIFVLTLVSRPVNSIRDWPRRAGERVG